MSKIFDPENRFSAALSDGDRPSGGPAPDSLRTGQDPGMPTKDEIEAKSAAIDAKLSATEARIEASMSSMRTSFAEFTAQMTTRMGSIETELKHMPTTWTMITTMGGFSAAVVGVILGVMSFAADRFDGGFAMGSGLSAPFEAIRAENRQLVAEQAARIDALDRKLDVLLDAVRHNQASQHP